MIKKLCAVILVLFACIPVTVSAQEGACIFFAPQSMNENNEIIVPIYTKNLPKVNDGLCGIEFQFAYDTECFSAKTDDKGAPLLGTSWAMLVQNTDIVDVSEDDGVISVSYIDFGGKNSVVSRDGPLFYFTLIPKNPNALWNSDDYYPLRFVPGSVNLITLDREDFSLSGIGAEGIDTYVGGYNAFPTFEPPNFEEEIEFRAGSSAVYVNGEAKENDAPSYIKDEFMVPLRSLAETVGMEITWDGETQTVSVFRPYTSAYFDMQSGDVYINAKLREDLQKPEITNERTFVPVSTVQALFGNSLNIENSSDRVSLNFNKNNTEEE